MWLVPAAPASPFPSQEWWPCQSSQQPGAGGQTGPGLACSCTRAGDCWQKATFNNIHTLQLCDETLQLNRVSVFEQENNLILPAQKFIKYHLRISMHAVIMIRKLSLYAIDKYLRVGFTLININIFSINYPKRRCYSLLFSMSSNQKMKSSRSKSEDSRVKIVTTECSGEVKHHNEVGV